MSATNRGSERIENDEIDWLILARKQGTRFWEKVRLDGDCWIWTGGYDKDGYGKFQITTGERPPLATQKHVRAHRLAWEMWNGPSDPGLVSMHCCDTPACCNPFHIRLGSQLENRRDCAQKGRTATGKKSGRHTCPDSYPLGEAHPNSSLTIDLVRKIRELRKDGLGVRRIANRLGVGQGACSGVISGKTWRHVT